MNDWIDYQLFNETMNGGSKHRPKQTTPKPPGATIGSDGAVIGIIVIIIAALLLLLR